MVGTLGQLNFFQLNKNKSDQNIEMFFFKNDSCYVSGCVEPDSCGDFCQQGSYGGGNNSIIRAHTRRRLQFVEGSMFVYSVLHWLGNHRHILLHESRWKQIKNSYVRRLNTRFIQSDLEIIHFLRYI